MDYIKTDKLKKEFSKRLSQVMLDQGFYSPRGRNKANTQTLADSCGVSRQMAAKYLNGLAIPEIEVLHSVSDWLMCDPWWLLYGNKKEEREAVSNKISIALFMHLVTEMRLLITTQASRGASSFDVLMENLVMIYNNAIEVDGNIETKKRAAAIMVNFIKNQYES